MKRQITAARPTPIKAPKSPRGIENQLADMIEFMVDQMAKRYRNQVLNKLQVSTVDKFADAQTGNFSAILLRLSRQAKKSILKQFSNDRIETISQQMLSKLDQKSKREFYERVAAKTGINITDLIAKEGLKATTNALMLETAQWIQTLRDDALQSFTNNTLFAMTQGESLDTIVEQFDDVVSERKNHAKFLARNQVQNYNSITTKIRAQNLGITKAIWETAGDERVRPSHEDREGKEFDLADGLYSSVDGLYLLPGTDYNCRCTYTMIIPEDVEEADDSGDEE
jgi:SPP1 gp7 family putative phage head morphogenesis protein